MASPEVCPRRIRKELRRAEPGSQQTTAVINPRSELIVGLYGTHAGTHTRTANGVATVPLKLPVVISAEVQIAGR
jgi:hypothetical protein